MKSRLLATASLVVGFESKGKTTNKQSIEKGMKQFTERQQQLQLTYRIE